MKINDYMFIYEVLNKEEIALNVSLKDYSSFKIGGTADIMLFPSTIKKLVKILKYFKRHNIKFIVLGRATNVLICGDKEVVVSLKKLTKMTAKNNVVYAEAGTSLFSLNKFLCENELSGLERLYGIPASVGGGIVQNCGAYSFSISDKLKTVTYFDGKKVKRVRKEKLDFSYRFSTFKEHSDYVVLGAEFKLRKGNKEDIQKRLNDILTLRKSRQPYDLPSAGSVFKKCNGVVVSKLIDELGLKGKTIGGAMVSTKHAGFIVNYNNATYEDVLGLIDFIKKKIKLEKNIDLDLEIVII